jgi:hypothetical protein
MDSNFVAGEIRGDGDTTDEIVIGSAPLHAEGPLLGTLDEDEKTRLFAIPPELSEPTHAETQRTPVVREDEDDETQIASFIAPAPQQPAPQQPAPQQPAPQQPAPQQPTQQAALQQPPQRTIQGQAMPKPPPTPGARKPPPTPSPSTRRRAVRVADTEGPSTKPFPRLPSPDAASGSERE